jgi:CRISPR-associated protein Cas1
MATYRDGHGRVADLHELPKIRDRLSYLYLEHGRLDKSDQSIAFWTDEGKTAIPIASIALLMLGPGTRVTHAAMMALADNNCLAVWCGEEGVRFYSWGTGGTRSSAALLCQARLCADETTRLAVVRRMYEMRFRGEGAISPEMTLEQLRGREGLRVRNSYADWSAKSGVEWVGRSYDRQSWRTADPVNRALSAANSCLYGLCHAAILSVGYSPALGFIHTGKQLSFVYDIADLYKLEVTIPVAFRIAAEGEEENLERRTRLACRDIFRESRLLERIIPDMRHALLDDASDEEFAPDEDPAMPTEWWGDSGARVGGPATASEREELE